jgi:hypothetical protein
MKTTTSLQNSSNLQPSDLNQLQSDAIKLYTDAAWNLADVLTLAKTKLGRNRLREISVLPFSKIKWLCAIAGLKCRNLNLLPEHHFEVIGLENARKWLNKAEAEKWNPNELRAKIREAKKTFKTEKKLTGIAQWPKNLTVIESELKRLTSEQRQLAVERIKQQLNVLSNSSSTNV